MVFGGCCQASKNDNTCYKPAYEICQNNVRCCRAQTDLFEVNINCEGAYFNDGSIYDDASKICRKYLTRTIDGLDQYKKT